jgi:hypothetical protein
MASFSETPRPRGRAPRALSVRTAGSIALVLFVLLVALGFVR